MNLHACADSELVRMVRLGQPSSLELELADRLEKALDAIDDLQDDIDALQGELRELRAGKDDEGDRP